MSDEKDWLDHLEAFALYLGNRLHKLGGILGQSLPELLLAIKNLDGPRAVDIIKKSAIQMVKLFMTDGQMLVLGPYQSGKTALLLYIKHGRAIKPGGPTGAMEEKKEIALFDEVTFDIPIDLGGDALYREAGVWKTAIQKHNPRCLLYVIDGSDQPNKPRNIDVIHEELRKCLDDSLSVYKGDPITKKITMQDGSYAALKVIYVFLSHYDLWKTDPAKNTAERLRHSTAIELANYIYEKNMNVNTLEVKHIHLDPDATDGWPEAKTALQELTISVTKTFTSPQ